MARQNNMERIGDNWAVELVRERNILRAVIENTETCLAYLDNKFNFIQVNPAYTRYFGYEQEQLIGRNHFDLFPSEENKKAFNHVLRTGEPIRFYEKPFLIDGFVGLEDIYWDWSLIPIKDAGGTVRGLVLSLSDVTEKVRIRQELKQALDKVNENTKELVIVKKRLHERSDLDLIPHSLTDPVLIFDKKKRIIKVNSLTVEQLGFNPVGLEFKDLVLKLTLRNSSGDQVSPEDFPFNRVFQGETIKNEYFRFTNVKGRNYIIRSTMAPLNINGKIDGAIVTWQDMTEQSRVLFQLHEERSVLKAVVEQLPAGVIVAHAPTGKILFANNRFTEIWRLKLNSKTAVDGQTHYKGFHLDGRPYEPEEWPLTRSIIKGETVKDEELIIQRGNGTRGVVLFSSAPIRDSVGKITAGVAVFLDITERKQQEEKLRSFQQLQLIVESLPDAIFALDERKKVIAWNRAMEKLTGVKKEAIIGKGNFDSFPFFSKQGPMPIEKMGSGDIESLSKDFKNIVLENETTYAETFVAGLNQGKGAHLGIKTSMIKDNHDRLVGAIVSIRDQTKQKEMEDELLKIQKLESVGILAGGIAHDFNNLLTGILGKIQLARIKFSNITEIRQDLSGVEEAILRAKDLTQQLLTFSKGGAPVKKTASLVELIKNTADFAVRGSKVRCEIRIAKNLWLVDMDEGQISQVISNLVINADQAMPKGGVIRIKAENVVVEKGYNPALVPGKYVKLTVSDEGVGIPPELTKRIFDPYFTTKEKGSGLGLATSYAIIKNHNGYIDVASKPGAGTTFSIFLPASEGTPVQKEKKATAIAKGRGRLLLMDDEETIRRSVGELLRLIGYEVDCARDGMEAITRYIEEKKKGRPYDLLIMDLTIPGGMGGQEAVAKLRQFDPGVKAIISSGYSDKPILSNFQKYGFQAVVTKPYKIEELNEVIRKVIES
ncbi:MAG TPA: PAS domain S-box protein [Firmicutes bacterium]|nr:PAS domain S-box protein [Bacillota bacterium]